MLLVNQLKNQEDMSEAEKIIAQYVLHDPKSVTEMTVEQFSSEVYASKSSVVRFCQKFGFRGFSDFKIKLATELSKFLESDSRIEVDMPIHKDDNEAQVLQTFTKLHMQALEDAYHNIDPSSFEKAINLIHNAPFISVWGYSNSMLVALDFHDKMRAIGYPTVCNPMTGMQTVHPSRHEGEVAIIFSTFADTDWVQAWISSLKAASKKIILISANPKTELANVVDAAILTENTETRTQKMGVFASRTTMMYVSDCLYAMLFQKDYERNVMKLFGKSVDNGKKVMIF